MFTRRLSVLQWWRISLILCGALLVGLSAFALLTYQRVVSRAPIEAVDAEDAALVAPTSLRQEVEALFAP